MTSALWVVPFGAMVLAIAVLPLSVPHLWERKRFIGAVSAVAASPVVAKLLLESPVALGEVLLYYASFVLMLGSLYVVASGLSAHLDLPAHPLTNASMLLLGAVLASVIGTTGASMLLIRPLLDINAERRRVAHTVLFFIVLVSNVGGCLTPLGDPPLFIGYLSGVPFLFTLRLLSPWAVSIGFLLAVYLALDARAYATERPADRMLDERTRRPLRVRGTANVVLLAAIVAATALLPAPWREAVWVACALLTFAITPRGLREEVEFRWHPLLEVGILFAGLFVTMEPALRVLSERAPGFGLDRPWHYFWGAGVLSAVLDNAPTYAAFLAVARGLGRPEVAGVPVRVLEALSAGAVFFGALTYIGNGPNFLVRSIAQARGVAMPSFFGYAWRAAAVLLPLFALLTALFFASA